MSNRNKIIVASVGFAIVTLVLIVLSIRWALSVEIVQMPITLEFRKMVIYRDESKEYQFKTMKQKAQEGINLIDQFYEKYPEQITPSPAPPAQKEEGAETKNVDERSIVLAQPHGVDLWKIYQLETQRGKTDYCRIRGNGYGGFGVMTDGEVVCYSSFELAVDRANYWFDRISENRNLAQSLCKWSGYGDVDNCEYAVKFMSI